MAQNSELNVRQRFGKAVRRRRRELDLSQEVLAERAELNRAYLSEVERGRVNPSLEIVEKLADALDISVADLFSTYGVDLRSKSTD